MHGVGANQPRCVGGVNKVLDVAKGDWIEFTKDGAGVIYQTGIGKY